MGEVPGPTWAYMALLGSLAALQRKRVRGKEDREVGSFLMELAEAAVAVRVGGVWPPTLLMEPAAGSISVSSGCCNKDTTAWGLKPQTYISYSSGGWGV